jgi:transposase-like protein
LVAEAARSGQSIRAFCRDRGVTEGQFYGWRKRLNGKPPGAAKRRTRPAATGPTFALVSERAASLEQAGVELVLGDGRRLRIGPGVEAATLRTVLAVLEPGRC